MSRNTLIVLPFFPMSQLSHNAPVVKPAERKFVPPLPQEMPVAEKASRISPELQAEQDAVQEQMAEARVALQTANEEIGGLRETIRQLEGKMGLTEEEQADLSESKQQLVSYEQDLAESANRLSSLFERNREIQAFIESASSGTSGEAIVEQVKQTKEAEARAKETPSERAGREYQEVTTQYDGAKRTIAEKEGERGRLAEELKEAEYAAGRVDFETRPITEEVHKKHEAAVARVEQIAQQIKAADAVIAQQKDALVDAERKSIALFSGPVIEGADGKRSVRDVVAEQAGKSAKENVAKQFQTPEEGVAWMRNEYLPARMKETILPSRRDLEAEFKQREEAAKRAGTSISRQDFLEEVRKRAESDQTVQGLVNAAKTRTADADSGDFLKQQREYLDAVLSGFANTGAESRLGSNGRWEAGEERREALLKLGQKELIKESQHKANWVEWMRRAAESSEKTRAQGEVHARADAAEKITEQETSLKKQHIDRPAFEEKIAAIRAEQKRMDDVRTLQRAISDFEGKQAKEFDQKVAEKRGTTERLSALQKERQALIDQTVTERDVRDAESAILSAEMQEKIVRGQLNAEESKKKVFLDESIEWYPASNADVSSQFTRRQVMNGEPGAILDAYLNTQKAALQKLVAEEPRKLFNQANYNRWMESRATLEKKIASVDGTKDEPGLLQKYEEAAIRIREKSEIDPETKSRLERSLREISARLVAARTEAMQKKAQFEQQAKRRPELDREIASATAEEQRTQQEALASVRAAQAQEKRAFLASQDQALLAETNNRTDIADHAFDARIAEMVAKETGHAMEQIDTQRAMEMKGQKAFTESVPRNVRAQEFYLNSEILKRAQAETDASRERAIKFVDSARETIKEAYQGEYDQPERRWQERWGNAANLTSDLAALLQKKQYGKGERIQQRLLNAWPQNG